MTSIYVLEADGSDLVKVGIADNVASRISSLQSGCPFKLKKYNDVRGLSRNEALLIEKKCHAELDRFRNYGEWFRVSPLEAHARIVRLVMERNGQLPIFPRANLDHIKQAFAL